MRLRRVLRKLRSDVETVAVVLTACATPTVWALDFGAMAGIGLLGVIASVLIVGVSVLNAVLASSKESWAAAELMAALQGSSLPDDFVPESAG